MSALWNFITLPLGLPIEPIWSFIGMLIIAEVAYRVAYAYGAMGDTSIERGIIHWIVRIPLYLALWILACVVIAAYRIIKRYWVAILLLLMVVVIVAVIYIKKKRVNSNENEG